MSDPIKEKRPARLVFFRLPGFARVEGLPSVVVFLLVVGLFMATAPRVFLGWPIYFSFLTTVPPLVVLAIGLTLVIAAGEIDLSFPSVMAFAGFLFAWCVNTTGSAWLAVIAALAGGALVGVVNGVLVAVVGVPSIIVTIGTQFLWAGVASILSGGLSNALQQLASGSAYAVFAGTLFDVVPMQAIWALGLAIFMWFILNRHRFGEHVLFIGDNRNVAKVVGINVPRETVKLFTLMGVLAGFATVLLTLENLNYFSTQGQGYLLPALAGVFIGGTSVFGGTATIVGTFFGTFVIGMLEAGIVATGIAGFWVQAIEGVVFIVAVILHLLVENPARLRVLREKLRFGGR
ncbi:simple sugar transport system permease protein [Paraburkholderia atlantica]|uniref:Simple sugar transport system permease protein n=1 Tax=Paraburkholderia atlantica TaxID=2654982 RepID=A0A7W8TL69_PARAM|nr:ABC transporter permease [Paraburkholderia atlantica]MBB5417446.1 simple sugar transport system permease protein [Paraburkholderia atlantica]MBB5425934.1 simple sugar transport system permease protein [Paraburkholderia atlantica]MBB5507985.1 simple sugar transport system permease protein [Paraburkholderia atlantica]